MSRTSWILSNHHDLEVAAGNLADREGITKPYGRRNSIHGMTAAGTVRGKVDPRIGARVTDWFSEQPDIDAAIWTGLGVGRRWSEHGYDGFSVPNALDYLQQLDGACLRRVTDYVLGAPVEVDTPVRRGFMDSD